MVCLIYFSYQNSRWLRPKSSYISSQKTKSTIRGHRHNYSLKSKLTNHSTPLQQNREKARTLKDHHNNSRISKNIAMSNEDLLLNRKEKMSNLMHYVNVLTNHRKSEQYFIKETNPVTSCNTQKPESKNSKIARWVKSISKFQSRLIKMIHPEQYMKPLLRK